ncbi:MULTISPECIES: hypothetical protein [Saccharothrix]|uniref:hypothetical protein n=1 Tax=Saccharothrix TaxID=2071 RepID=UPI0011613538|nr:hypothetical protein [Saccharothrix sp. CB00851]
MDTQSARRVCIVVLDNVAHNAQSELLLGDSRAIKAVINDLTGVLEDLTELEARVKKLERQGAQEPAKKVESAYVWLDSSARLMALALTRELYAGQSARVAAALSAQRGLTPKQIAERLGLDVRVVEAMIEKALSDPLDQQMMLTFLDAFSTGT